jgi:putative phage-type endonuclease
MIDHELRRRAISSSDLGAIFGVSPYDDQFTLWARKRGQLEAREVTPQMRMGKHFELGIAQAYSEITGREIEWRDETVTHPTEPWMVASPDALIVGEKRGLDCKLVHWTEKKHWGDNADRIPEHIQLQMWWLMAVTEYDRWDVAAYMGDGLPTIYEFTRDLELERVIVERARAYYDKYVIGTGMPPMGAAADNAKWLQQIFPTHKRPDMRLATEEEIELLVQYAEVRDAERQINAEKAKLEDKLRFAVADREGIEVPGSYTFTWRRTKDSIEIDYKSMAIGLAQKYLGDEERRTLTGIYTHPVAGYRKIRFTDLTRAAGKENAA